MRGSRLVPSIALVLSAGALTSCADQATTAPLQAPAAPRAVLDEPAGCAPGFWKQEQHLGSWIGTGFSPFQSLESVFNVPDAFDLDDVELAETLSFTGGSGVDAAARILLRQSVAALLNAATFDFAFGFDYPLTTAQVIATVNAALASGDRSTMLALAAELGRFNNLGCPLS